jgi:hypothetical protein
MKQLSILAFEALPHEGVPSSKWHNEPASQLSSATVGTGSSRWEGALGSGPAEGLGHECPVHVFPPFDCWRRTSPLGPD